MRDYLHVVGGGHLINASSLVVAFFGALLGSCGQLGPSGDVVTAARPITTWPHARGEPKSNSIGARFGSFVAVVAFFGARLGCDG